MSEYMTLAEINRALPRWEAMLIAAVISPDDTCLAALRTAQAALEALKPLAAVLKDEEWDSAMDDCYTTVRVGDLRRAAELLEVSDADG